jgi:ABC-type uncharacterized transport system permease subunit
MSQETLNIILTSVVVPVLIALTTVIVNYLNKLGTDLKAKADNRELDKYITIAEDAISTAVTSVTQTFVDTIKGTDGWDKEAMEQAFEDAKHKAILIMGFAAQEALNEAYGDVDEWIDNKIEAYVNRTKRYFAAVKA